MARIKVQPSQTGDASPEVALITQWNAFLTKMDVLTAKMNADAGITDANYAVDFASTLGIDVTN